MTKDVRRTDFAYWVTDQRVADYNQRAATTRAVCLVAAVAAAVCVAGSLRWWTWPLLAVPALGLYLAFNVARYVMTSRLPREPLAAWCSRVDADSQGVMGVNVSSLAEVTGAACLAATGPWAMASAATAARLVAVAASAGWLASLASAIMVDVAWYNPDQESWPPLERLRTGVGLLAAVLLAAVCVPATWTSGARLVVAAICAALLAVQLRVRETDRALHLGAIYADRRELVGRETMTRSLHTLVGNPLIHLKRQAAGSDPDMFDAVRQVEGGYRETLALDSGVDVTADWPGVMISRLRAIEGQYGILINFSTTDEPMVMEDRMVARIVLDDLAENAAKAGATRVDVVLELDDRRYTVSVIDNAAPFSSGTWLREGGGLVRLQRHLREREGNLSKIDSTDGKEIRAHWRAYDEVTTTR